MPRPIGPRKVRVSVGVQMKRSLAAVLLFSTTAMGASMEHAVIIHFQYGSTDLGALFKAEEQLEAAIAQANAGELDGNEVATDGSDGFIYMYGPDADKLLKAIEPVLASVPFMKGAKITRRYGPPEKGVKEAVTTVGR
jgi:hypothetical protein